MWKDAHPTQRGVDEEFERERRKVRGPGTLKVGGSYLLRSLADQVHDILVAFTLLQQDETGCTIAWRALHTWPVSNRGSSAEDPYWWVSEAPQSITSRDVDSLMSSLARIRAAARFKLLSVPAEITERYSGVLSQPQTGVTRLLASDRYVVLFETPGGGAYFSFATGASERASDADIALTRFGYSRAAGSTHAYVLEIGSTSLEMITEPFELPHGELSPRDQERWRFLTACVPPEKGQRWSSANADEEQARRLEFGIGIRPDVGHTCLVRSIIPGQHDVLAVFTTAEVDDAGVWIVWRVLRNRSLREDSKPR
jgi:hypothetical protein